MGPLKQEINKVLEAHIIRLNYLVGIFNLASIKLNNYTIIKSGFRKTGIVPINRNAFNDNYFVASLTHENSSPAIFNEFRYNNEVLVIKSTRISLKRVDGEIHIELT